MFFFCGCVPFTGGLLPIPQKTFFPFYSILYYVWIFFHFFFFLFFFNLLQASQRDFFLRFFNLFEISSLPRLQQQQFAPRCNSAALKKKKETKLNFFFPRLIFFPFKKKKFETWCFSHWKYLEAS